MENVILKDLIRSTKGKFIFGNPKQSVFAVSTDTRKIKRTDVFFALKGKNYDGHQFVSKAIEEGVNAIVVSHLDIKIDTFPELPAVVLVEDTLKALGDFALWYRQQFKPLMISVSGSNGKTTTKEMIFSILGFQGQTLANFKSYNNRIGVPLTLFNLDSDYKYCVCELGISLKDEMDRLIEITKPDISVVTNIGKTHLEFLESVEQVFIEETKPVKSLLSSGVAILNIDDPCLNKLKPTLKCKVITYGFNSTGTESDVFATDIMTCSDELKFKLHVKNKTVNVNLPAIGKFNVGNALAASAVGYSVGIDIVTIKNGLERVTLPRMRMEKIKLPQGATIINDAYNANPDSVRQALTTLVETYPDREKIVVLGDMLELGKHSETEHKSLGEFLCSLPIAEIYLYGYAMKNAVISGSTNMHYFPESESERMIMKLKSKLDQPIVIFLKASRAIGLEKITDVLVEL